ncbi:MAG: outer membrane protein assembly factor BamB family protein [Gaiellaceae bacterium]
MKRAAFGVAVLVLVGLGLAAAYVIEKRNAARNVHGSSTVEFSTTETVPTIPAELKTVQWPLYGFDPQRARAVAEPGMRPPFHQVWVAGGGTLLEFPPVIGYGRLFLASNAGNVLAFDARTGSRAWTKQTHRCVAATPAVYRGTVFEAFLNTPPCNASPSTSKNGEVIAFSTGFGVVRWRRTIGPSETSPLVVNKLVYVGDWRGDVWALREGTGAVVWRFHAGGAVKGGIAYSDGSVFFGAYDSRLYALEARTGKLLWTAQSQDRLGGRGQFYSTPAVAYGRVYIGSTDGKVYSFGATTGTLRWSQSTGGYVYASPAVWQGEVLIGSYSRRFFALDAATGDIRWSVNANGPISGSPTVINDVVYFATLKGRTYGLDARTGTSLWTFPDGRYSPVVADSKRLYLIGYSKLYGFVPVRQ